MVSVFMLVMMLTGSPQEMMVPEGTVLPVVLNERISTATVEENDPILFSLADDIRAGGHRGAVLIPRGSNVVGRVVRTDRAGHFVGRATMDIRMEKIVTPTGDVYDGLSAKVVDLGKSKGRKGQVKADGEIQGPVHRKRDAFLLLFPPTTVFQLMAIPARGPDVVLPPETRLYVKLMTPIYVVPQVAQEFPQAPAAVARSLTVPVPQPVMPQAIRLSWQDLDRMVSPIALYPDPLLYAVLSACSHPDQVAQAVQWVQQNGGLPPVSQGWDANVQAVAIYPDLLRRMSADPVWMAQIGTAYAVQRADVISSVQRLRQQVRGVRYAVPVTAPVYIRP